MIQQPSHPYRALSPNMQGRDWFVGDIHGCYTKLDLALKRVGFNEALDRLISVGDLVDRGNYSEFARRWIEAPFFHAVRGNHEDLYLEWYSLRHDRDAQEKFENEVYFKPVNGGSWVKKIRHEEHEGLAAVLGQLPYFLAVPHSNGSIAGVVHAELPDGASWPGLINMDLDSELRKSMTWGRQRWRGRRGRIQPPEDRNQIPGLDVLVCGHVRTRDAIGVGNIVYLDTGGWSDGEFSVIPFEDLLDMTEDA